MKVTFEYDAASSVEELMAAAAFFKTLAGSLAAHLAIAEATPRGALVRNVYKEGTEKPSEEFVAAATSLLKPEKAEQEKAEPEKAEPEKAEASAPRRRTKAQMAVYRAALAEGKSEAEADALSYAVPRDGAPLAAHVTAPSKADAFFDDVPEETDTYEDPKPNISVSPEDRVSLEDREVTKADVIGLVNRAARASEKSVKDYATTWVVTRLQKGYNARGLSQLDPGRYAEFYAELSAELDRLGV